MRDLEATLKSLLSTPVGDALTRPLLDAFPVSGVSIATVGDVLGSETIGASDAIAARLDELQFDLSEGPCWDAMRSGRPFIAEDVGGDVEETWPSFGPSLLEVGIRALFVFPLKVGPLQLGAIDMYCVEPQPLDRATVEQGNVLARAVSKIVLRDALSHHGSEAEPPVGVHSRRLVHQATGKVIVQADVPPDEALLLIQGIAFSSGRRVVDVSEDIMQGRVSFTATSQGIEDSNHE